MIPYKLLAYGVAVAALLALGLGYGDYQYGKGVKATTATYEAALAKQKIEAATTLLALTEVARKAERALQVALHNQEIQDASNQKIVAKYQADLRRLAALPGGLRDPNAARCGRSSGGTQGDSAASASAGTADPTQAGGVLSEQLSGLLLRLTAEADEINLAYASCRADTINLRTALP